MRRKQNASSPVQFDSLEGRTMMSASPLQLPTVPLTGHTHLPAVQSVMQDFHRVGGNTFQDFHRGTFQDFH